MSTQWKGLSHYPLGNASLDVIGNNLHLNNIGYSGNDGMLIELPDSNSWELFSQQIPINDQGKTLTVCYRGIDQWGRMKTFGEICHYMDPAGIPHTALNSWLLSQEFEFTAYLNGQETYHNTFQVPEKANWLPLIFAAAVVIVKSNARIKYKNVDGVETFIAEYTWGSIANPGTEDENKWNIFNEEVITANSFKVTSKFPYESGATGAQMPKISNILVSGKNLENLICEDETHE